MAPVRGCTAWRVPSWKSGDGWRVVRVAAKLVPYWQVTGSWIGVGCDDRNAMIGVKLAERLNVQPGDNILLVDHNPA